MQNPFTSTYSKLPEYTYIFTEEVAEISENFRYDSPSESVYKITGVRGSGKTVMLAKIEGELLSEEKLKISLFSEEQLQYGHNLLILLKCQKCMLRNLG